MAEFQLVASASRASTRAIGDGWQSRMWHTICSGRFGQSVISGRSDAGPLGGGDWPLDRAT